MSQKLDLDSANLFPQQGNGQVIYPKIDWV